MFSLKRPIAPNITADGDDVFNMKAALRKIGFYRGPADPIADHEMIRGIKNLQAATGLAVDGVVKPNGPTALLLAKLLSANDGDADNPISGTPPGKEGPHVYSSVNAAVTVNLVVGINAIAAVNVGVEVAVAGYGRHRKR
ncbi:MAG: peptidoglycan-binding domain-containing protein [Alphaproteobacteria bacterium]|tara:strand:+ start:210 stop:629 length:420 start_codon:yes stop_codon:yes gene_type:complete